MADELDTLYSHLLRAKTAIDPLSHVEEVWPYQKFFEVAAGPFINGLRASYLEDRSINQVVGAVVPKVVNMVDTIQYAAFLKDYNLIFKQSYDLCMALQGLPGGNTDLYETLAWQALPGGNIVLPEAPQKSPMGWQGLPGGDSVKPEAPQKSPDKSAPPSSNPPKQIL